MGEELEDKVLNKKVSFSFKDIKWVIVTGVTVVLWIVTAVLWVNDRSKQEDEIKSISSENSTLKTKVATLEGQIQGVQTASEIFMQNPPSELKFRIDLLEKRVDVLELPGSNPSPIETVSLDTTSTFRRNHN